MILFALAVWLPTATLTPGVKNPKVTQANIHETICKRGYTKTIRPAENITERLKKVQLKRSRYHDTNPVHYEEDHLISLEIGGHPSDPRNLWPQPYAGPCGAKVKDKLEDKLHVLVCRGTIPLATAQYAISTDWVKAYNKWVGPLKCE